MPHVILCDAASDDCRAEVVVTFVHRTLRFRQWQDRMAGYAAAGVREVYLIHPTWPMAVEGWLLEGRGYEPISELEGWVSPRLGVRFSTAGGYVRVVEACHPV